MNTLLMWIAGLFAAVLAAFFAVPYFVDWNSYRGVFEEEASRLLGREVRVGGKVNLRLLPTPYVRFEKLRIADTRPGTGEPLFRAENFTLWLSVPPLLQGNLEVRHVALDKPVVRLAIEETGAGNWTTLGIRPGALPFVPQNVAFQSIEILDGTLAVEHPRAGEVVRLEAISGELSAEALFGPYKFAGDVQAGGVVHDVRLATAPADADSTVRLKATVRPKARAGTVYQLDGSLAGLSARPRLEGALTASVPLPQLPGARQSQDASSKNDAGARSAPAAASGPADKPAPSTGPVVVEVKGKLAADSDHMELKDVTASIEHVGQPQLLTGAAKLAWGTATKLDFSASSRWLDLDRLAGAHGRALPLDTSAALVAGLMGVLPGKAETRGKIAIDQVTLGGEALANLDVAVARETGAAGLKIERLFASLPAGARLAVDGALTTGEASPSFDGTVTAAGPSLRRLVAWALADVRAGEAAPDGQFSLDGRLAMTADGVSLVDATATFADRTMTGAMTLPLRGAGAVYVAVDADTFDSNWLWNGGISRPGLQSWIMSVAGASEGDQGAQTNGRRDLKLALRAGTLKGADRSLRDVVAALEVAKGVVKIERLAFRSADGLDIDLQGQISGRDGARTGIIEGSVGASNAKALAVLVEVLGLPAAERARHLATLAPLKLAGRVHLGSRTPASVDITVDGSAAGGRLAMGARLDGGQSSWRSMPAELSFSAEDISAEHLVALVFGRIPGEAGPAGGDAMKANIAIKAFGAPAHGMVGDMALSRPGLTIAYNGRAVLDEAAIPALEGTLEVAADHASDVMELAGVRGMRAANTHAVTGTLGFNIDHGGKAKLTPSGLTIAGSEVSGTMWVTRGEAGRMQIEGEIDVDQASVQGLLASLVSGAPQPVLTTAADLAFQQSAGLWTDQPFSAEAFDRYDGRLALRLERLSVAPGLALSGARVAFSFKPGRIDAELAGANALNGSFTGHVGVFNAAAGARLEAELGAGGLSLAALAEAVASRRSASGTAAASLSFAGQALSPRSLIGALKGTGSLKLTGAGLDGLSPSVVSETVAAAFDKNFQINTAALQSEIRNRISSGRVEIGSREVGLEIADGVLRLARFDTTAAHGNVETLATVDLSSMQAETEWRLIAAAAEAGKPAWPMVSVYYTGVLGALAKVEPRVALGNFERELTVRRMEREVEELERLRRLDEERAQQERERQRALAEAARLERERQKALDAERQRQRFEQRNQQPLAPPAPAPQGQAAPTTGATSNAGTAAQTLADPAMPAAAATANSAPADAAASRAAVPGEQAKSTAPAADTPQDASSAPTAPQAADASPATATPSAAPRRSRSEPKRRAPTASDTMLKSFNPSLY